MRINLAAPLRDYKNEVIVDERGEEVNLRKTLCNALAAVLPMDRNSSLAEKVERDALLRQLWDAGATPDAWDGFIELTIEDAAKLKARAGEAYPSAVLVGAIVRALESSPS